MPTLKNARHERFAQGLADGKSQVQAYIDAGYAAKSAGAHACKLLRREASISQRRDEILRSRQLAEEKATARAIERAGWDKARILSTLGEVVERCMQAKPVLNMKGEQMLCELPDGALAAAYTFDARGATQALRLLGLEEGMFVQRHEVRRSPLDGLPPEFVRQLRARLEGAMQQKGVRIIDGAYVLEEAAAAQPPGVTH